MMQRHNYIAAWHRGDEKFHDINDILAQQAFKELDEQMRVSPKNENG